MPSECFSWSWLRPQPPIKINKFKFKKKHKFFSTQLSSQSNSHIHTWWFIISYACLPSRCHPDVSSSVVYITTNLRRDYITTNLFSLFRSTYLPSFPNILTIIFYLLIYLRFHFSKKMVLKRFSKQWVSFSDSSLIILELTRGRQLGFRLLFLVLILKHCTDLAASQNLYTFFKINYSAFPNNISKRAKVT